jgi:hypothetical protein
MFTVWLSAIPELRAGRHKAVPLESVDALAAAGVSRRDIAAWAPRCAAGRLRIFAVCELGSGRRVAHFGLRCVVESQSWVVEFHSLPPDALRPLLELLAAVRIAYQQKTRGRPHPALGAPASVRPLLAQMDLEDAGQEMDEKAPADAVA